MNISKLIGRGVIISILCASAWYIINGPQGLIRYFRLKKNITKKQTAIAHLKKSITVIEDRLDRLAKDDAAVEHTLRYDLCYGQTNELIYILKKN